MSALFWQCLDFGSAFATLHIHQQHTNLTGNFIFGTPKDFIQICSSAKGAKDAMASKACHILLWSDIYFTNPKGFLSIDRQVVIC